MLYKTRPGVILAEVCGEKLLAAPYSLWKACPYVTQINDSSAFLWKQLENGATPEQLRSAVLSAYEIDSEDQLDKIISNFLHQLLDIGYLTVEREEK